MLYVPKSDFCKPLLSSKERTAKGMVLHSYSLDKKIIIGNVEKTDLTEQKPRNKTQ